MLRACGLGLVAVALAAHVAGAQCPDGRPCKPTPSARSVAVLPFKNLSGDATQQYFADGISDAITDALAKLPGVSVKSRTSAFAFRDSDIGVRAIADSLGVAKIVEGTVAKSGNRVRVSARLIEATTGNAIWSEQVTSSEADLFELQDTVSRAIAGRLGDASGKRLVTRSTASVEAQDRYLRGRDLLYRRDPASLLTAREEFRRAIVADPRYAPAWAGLSQAYSLYLVISEWPLVNKATSADSTYGLAVRALAAANRAIALDSTLPEAWGVRGYLQLYASAPPSEAQAGLRRAIQLRPAYAEAHGWLAQSLAYTGGSIPDAIAAANRSVELDPASIGMRLGYVGVLWGARDAARALENARAVKVLRPEFGAITAVYEGPALVQLGRADECLRLNFRRMLQLVCIEGAGRREEAAALADSLAQAWERGSNDLYGAFHITLHYGMTGQVDAFIAWWRRQYDRAPLAVAIDHGGMNDPALSAEGGRAGVAVSEMRRAAWDRILRESRTVRLP